MSDTTTADVKDVKPEPKFSQPEVDRIVQDRVAREQKKYQDYEDLKKFREEYESTAKERELKEMESRKEYDAVKQKWDAERNQFTTLLSQKDQEVSNMKIHNALYNETAKHSAYPDAVDLIKGQAVLDKDGTIKIKGRDSNGFETLLPVEEGVKKFLDEKPYLVKATGRTGAGTSSAQSTGQQVNRNLADELIAAQQSGDHKKRAEVKAAIRAKQNSTSQVLF